MFVCQEVDVEIARNGNLPTQENAKEEHSNTRKNILYTTDEVPPWHLCILLGLQVSEMIFFCIKLLNHS